MSIPEYLGSTYRYAEANVAGTGQDVINAIVPELVASGFTDQGGGWYRSPVDAAGRFFSVLMMPMPDGVTANLVQLDVKDQAGRLVMQQRGYCNATANVLRIYTGSHHFICDMGDGSVYEAIVAGMLDASPFPQGGAMDRYVRANATRRTNNDTYYGSSAYASMFDMGLGDKDQPGHHRGRQWLNQENTERPVDLHADGTVRRDRCREQGLGREDVPDRIGRKRLQRSRAAPDPAD